MFRLEHTGDLQLYVQVPGRIFGWNIVLNVPVGTFKNGKKFRRKLLILRAGFWAGEQNQWVSLWKKCLLSRTSNVYFSRLDRPVAYFIRYASWIVTLLAFGRGEC